MCFLVFSFSLCTVNFPCAHWFRALQRIHKLWSLIVRGRSSFTLLWGKSSVLWGWEDLNFTSAGTRFCCLHISLFDEHSSICRCPAGPVMSTSSCNNHMFDLNMSTYACPLNGISYCLSAFGYLSINAFKKGRFCWKCDSHPCSFSKWEPRRGNIHGSAEAVLVLHVATARVELWFRMDLTTEAASKKGFFCSSLFWWQSVLINSYRWPMSKAIYFFRPLGGEKNRLSIAGTLCCFLLLCWHSTNVHMDISAL